MIRAGSWKRFFGVGRGICLVLAIVLFVGVFSGCNSDKNGVFYPYFNNFRSSDAYNSLTLSLTLPEDVYFEAYDWENDVFMTKKVLKFEDGTSTTLYGFASHTEELLSPRYMHIVGINGDFAIVVRAYLAPGGYENRIGLVRFRGENIGFEYGFSYAYAAAGSQYTFLNDQYISIIGTKTSSTSAITDSFATIYDYTSAYTLLEIGRVGNTYPASKIQLYDDNLVIIHPNQCEYYRLNVIGSDGYFVKRDEYVPFSEAEYPIDSYPAENMEFNSYYIGNNWFIRSATYISDTEYTAYDLKRIGSDGVTYYMTYITTRYNTESKLAIPTDMVAMVANKYTETEMRYWAYLANTSVLTPIFLSNDDKPLYNIPVLPISEFVKDGYSLIYYYHINEDDAMISFALYNNRAEGINLSTIYMPLIFVDGVARQSADPNFDMITGNAEIIRYNDKRTIMATADQSAVYDNFGVQGGAIYVLRYVEGDSQCGAYDLNGRMILPYKYYELTPYFGEYCTASIIEGNGDSAKRVYYRVDKSGNELALNNVYALYNGLYSTCSDGKYGLYSNEGKQLLAGIPQLEEGDIKNPISVLQEFLIDGEYVKTIVTTQEDGRGKLYRLG